MIADLPYKTYIHTLEKYIAHNKEQSLDLYMQLGSYIFENQNNKENYCDNSHILALLNTLNEILQQRQHNKQEIDYIANTQILIQDIVEKLSHLDNRKKDILTNYSLEFFTIGQLVYQKKIIIDETFMTSNAAIQHVSEVENKILDMITHLKELENRKIHSKIQSLIVTPKISQTTHTIKHLQKKLPLLYQQLGFEWICHEKINSDEIHEVFTTMHKIQQELHAILLEYKNLQEKQDHLQESLQELSQDISHKKKNKLLETNIAHIDEQFNQLVMQIGIEMYQMQSTNILQIHDSEIDNICTLLTNLFNENNIYRTNIETLSVATKIQTLYKTITSKEKSLKTIIELITKKEEEKRRILLILKDLHEECKQKEQLCSTIPEIIKELQKKN